LRSDEQLLALFRAGSDDAFNALHDRYRQRLFAYVRQMLSAASRQDAEDVLQDVFVRAYGALRGDAREMNVRAWLYRVAHNRCIDHLRRPLPPAADVFEVSRKPLQDPVEEAQRRDDLSRLVEDIGRLPEQQRSALLMRELDGMSYADLANALGVTVPAVKSLLVRARVGLVDAADARDTGCEDIRTELVHACERGVKAPGRARRHMRTCAACREYRDALRGVQRSLAALSPVALGPLAIGAKLLGLGGAGGGAAAGGSAAGGAMAAGGGVASVTACKVAAVVCTAAITAGGAVEANQIVSQHHHHPKRAAAATAARPAVHRAAAPAAAPTAFPHRTSTVAAPTRHGGAAHVDGKASPAAGDGTITVPSPDAAPRTSASDIRRSGGTRAPVETETTAPVTRPTTDPDTPAKDLGPADRAPESPATPPTAAPVDAGPAEPPAPVPEATAAGEPGGTSGPPAR
jgi:RNA polymerase sigma factor (sigma-70 family)